MKASDTAVQNAVLLNIFSLNPERLLGCTISIFKTTKKPPTGVGGSNSLKDGGKGGIRTHARRETPS